MPGTVHVLHEYHFILTISFEMGTIVILTNLGFNELKVYELKGDRIKI